jgi:hypothetical protein
MVNMAKKIQTARKELTKALKKHADTVDRRSVSLKKSQRAAAAVQAACEAYAKAVFVATGLDSPFADPTATGLEPETIASLEAERDALATKPTEHSDATAESPKTAPSYASPISASPISATNVYTAPSYTAPSNTAPSNPAPSNPAPFNTAPSGDRSD